MPNLQFKSWTESNLQLSDAEYDVDPKDRMVGTFGLQWFHWYKLSKLW